MQRFFLVTGLCLALLAIAPAAYALSTEQSPAQLSGSSSNFNDPDEQMPAFVIAPTSSGSNNVVSFGNSSVTAPTMGETDSGASAFDQAYAHQQVKQ